MRYYCKYTKTPPALGRGSHPLEPLCLHPCPPMAFALGCLKASNSQPSSAIDFALTACLPACESSILPSSAFLSCHFRQCLQFHFIFESSFWCHASFPDLAIVSWSDASLNTPPYSIHLDANHCQLPCSRRLHHFWWQRCLMAALLVTRIKSPQNCANKRAEISDVSITNKSLLDFSGIWVP